MSSMPVNLTRDGSTQLINTKTTNKMVKDFSTPKPTITHNVALLGESDSEEEDFSDYDEEEDYPDKDGGSVPQNNDLPKQSAMTAIT